MWYVDHVHLAREVLIAPLRRELPFQEDPLSGSECEACDMNDRAQLQMTLR
jgi:hypothetical protein